MTRVLSSLVLLSTVVMAAGCGAKSDRPKTSVVTGTVTLGGKPVEGATVTFVPTSGPGGAVGVTDATGTYKASSFGGGDGARPGDYKVTIVKHDRPAAAAAPAGKPASGDLAADYQPDAPGAASAEPKNLLPGKYANPATTDLTAKVTEPGPNKIDFTLQP